MYDDFDYTHGPSKITRAILWSFLVFLLLALIWAKFAKLDEVTVGEGKVVPSSQIQVIQNLEGGIVQKVYVKEGEMVSKGQLLMQLDKTRFESSFEEGTAKATALKIKIARLQAVIDDQAFALPKDIVSKYPDLVNHENELYNSQNSEEQQLKTSFNLANKEFQLTKPLVDKGAASPVEVIRLERQVSDAQKAIDNFKSKALSDLNDAKAALLALQESNLGLEDRLTRTSIYSPVKGIVKQIKIRTVGGVSQPGMELMEIVPLDDTLLVEAKIKPRDIGFIRPKQKATVKITAYDYSIYGGLLGYVEDISADTITNEKGDSFYLIHVRTDKNYLGTKEKPLYIIPGMLASVDILTGKKTVLEYLLKPIFKARERALRER
jgi:adhesin transport system membrane fusion protein